MTEKALGHSHPINEQITEIFQQELTNIDHVSVVCCDFDEWDINRSIPNFNLKFKILVTETELDVFQCDIMSHHIDINEEITNEKQEELQKVICDIFVDDLIYTDLNTVVMIV